MPDAPVDRDLLSLTAADIDAMSVADVWRAMREAETEIHEIYARAFAKPGLDPKILTEDIETIVATISAAISDRWPSSPIETRRS